MIISKPYVRLVHETDPLKKIEYCARVCYASQDRIGEETAKPFVSGIMKRGHTSVIEHVNIVVKAANYPTIENLRYIIHAYEQRTGIPSYIRNAEPGHSDEYFSGNARAWYSILQTFPNEIVLNVLFREYPLFADFFQNVDLDYVVPMNAEAEIIPESRFLPDLHRTITAEIKCSRGISHELVRHRLLSPTQMSTRYVNSRNLEVIEPWWYRDESFEKAESIGWVFQNAVYSAELYYNDYLEQGAVPQLARGVLPNDTATVILLTGNLPAWQHFLDLRLDRAAHPDMQRIAKLFVDATEKEGYKWANTDTTPHG